MNQRIPYIAQFDSTREEQEIARQFTRFVSDEDSPSNEPQVWLVVEQQSFQITPIPEDDRHAQWFCWMLAKALIKVQNKRKRSGGL